MDELFSSQKASSSKTLGIVFTGGEGPDPERCSVLLGTEGQSALYAAADSGLLLAERAGFTPDWIVGDMDSLGAEGAKRLAAYPPHCIIRSPAAKDSTDTELALSLLRKEGCRRIWIAGGGGGRTDHLFAIRSLFERPCPPERWLTEAEDIRCIEGPAEPGAEIPPPAEAADPSVLPTVLNVSVTDGVVCNSAAYNGVFFVSVFPLGCGPWEARSSGLRWPLAGLPWNRGFFGVSNEAPEGRFSVTALRGRFMVMFPL